MKISIKKAKKGKPAVFRRLEEDISNFNTKVAIQKSNQGGAGSISHASPSKLPKINCQALTMSNSNLGKAILYGNVSQQRHLDLKLAELEKQRLLRMRNMEWKQVVTFRQMAKDNLRRSRSKDTLKSMSNSSVTSVKSSVRLPRLSTTSLQVSAQELESKVKKWKHDMKNMYGR